MSENVWPNNTLNGSERNRMGSYKMHLSLAQERDQWQALVNMAIHLQVPLNAQISSVAEQL